MSLIDTNAGQKNIVSAYNETSVSVDGVCYTQNLVLYEDFLLENWSAFDFAALTRADFEKLASAFAAKKIEVLLLGTGKTHAFAHPSLLAPLLEKQIPVECMSTHAACRTYNLLRGQERAVAAALLLF